MVYSTVLQKQNDRYQHDSKGSKKDGSCSSKWRTSEATTTNNNNDDRPSSKDSTRTSSKGNHETIVISGDDRVLKFETGDWIENRCTNTKFFAAWKIY